MLTLAITYAANANSNPEYKFAIGAGTDYSLIGVNAEISYLNFSLLYGISAIELVEADHTSDGVAHRGHTIGIKYYFNDSESKVRHGIGNSFGPVDRTGREQSVYGGDPIIREEINYGYSLFYVMHYDIGDPLGFKIDSGLGLAVGGGLPIAFNIGLAYWI